jgi:hypothetical protein
MTIAMANKIGINPLAFADPSEIAKRIVALMPEATEMTTDEREVFEAEKKEGAARYQEARFGVLPTGTYRILENGGFMGWHLTIEIDGEEVVLKEPDKEFESAYAVFTNKARADELARAEVAVRHGQSAADVALFKVVWSGTL